MIRLNDVSKVYDMGEIKTEALKGVDLEVRNGEFVCVLGPSGSGKSTMLNVISGLDTPTSGKIEVDGMTISNYSSKELTKFRRDYLSFIFQSYNLFQTLTVGENIELAAKISENPLELDDVLAKIGILEQKDKFPSQLSGGEQQRVSIARAVIKNPKIMFCDEPTGALDESTAKEVLGVLEMLNKEYKTTMIVISHNPNIGEMSDRIVKLNSGRIVEIKVNETKKSAKEIAWT
ncbi:ABC transporter ATP-binding protein [Mycoplasmatota bacterium]|nr:ABC transporter ATP-binding protein [Mycoplasmatota bacterium]